MPWLCMTMTLTIIWLNHDFVKSFLSHFLWFKVIFEVNSKSWLLGDYIMTLHNFYFLQRFRDDYLNKYFQKISEIIEFVITVFLLKPRKFSLSHKMCVVEAWEALFLFHVCCVFVWSQFEMCCPFPTSLSSPPHLHPSMVSWIWMLQQHPWLFRWVASVVSLCKKCKSVKSQKSRFQVGE